MGDLPRVSGLDSEAEGGTATVTLAEAGVEGAVLVLVELEIVSGGCLQAPKHG